MWSNSIAHISVQILTKPQFKQIRHPCKAINQSTYGNGFHIYARNYTYKGWGGSKSQGVTPRKKRKRNVNVYILHRHAMFVHHLLPISARAWGMQRCLNAYFKEVYPNLSVVKTNPRGLLKAHNFPT